MLYTDYQALLKVLKSEDVTGRISRRQLSLSEYDLDIFHVPGKDLAVADGLSRIQGWSSRSATEEESTMASFAAESVTGHHAMEGSQPCFQGGNTIGTTLAQDRPQEHPQHTQQSAQRGDLELQWAEWLDDPWYGQVVEFMLSGACNEEGALSESVNKVMRQRAKKFVFIEMFWESS